MNEKRLVEYMSKLVYMAPEGNLATRGKNVYFAWQISENGIWLRSENILYE